jgi:hypothetical protein
MIAQTQNKRKKAFKPQVEFEPTIPVFQLAKTVHAVDRAATAIGGPNMYCYIIKRRRRMSIDISTRLHKDSKDWNTKLIYTVQQDAAA